MLGVAHVGFARVLEEAGVRFLGPGGTSAGAINASIVATARESPLDVSWQRTFEILKACQLASIEGGHKLFSQPRQSGLPASLVSGGDTTGASGDGAAPGSNGL